MSELEEHIRRINQKVQQLLKQHLLLQRENEKLKTELEEVKKKAIEKDNYTGLLELRIEVLKASRGEMSEEEKKMFEKRINQYLKEVDRCIALLNE